VYETIDAVKFVGRVFCGLGLDGLDGLDELLPHALVAARAAAKQQARKLTSGVRISITDSPGRARMTFHKIVTANLQNKLDLFGLATRHL